MFKITHGKGFHITFENGYTVSVQWGPGNYADNYYQSSDEAREAGEKGSETAECAVWHKDGDLLEYEDWGGTVSNHSTPAEVLKLLNWAATQV